MRILILTIFILIISFSSLNFSFVKASGSGNYPPPNEGDWEITENTIVENETIILTGSLLIQDGGSLTLKNVSLKINSSSDGQYGIYVYSGSSFYIYDYDNNPNTISDRSKITAVNTNYEYKFMVDNGANFVMKNSELHEAGYEWGTDGRGGLTIKTSNAIIENNTISNNYQGILLYSSTSTNNIIKNNKIYNNEGSGVYIYSSSSYNIIKNNSIYSNVWQGIMLYNSADNNEIINNKIYSNGYTGSTINSAKDNKFVSNNIYNNDNYGVYIVYSSSKNNIFENCTISNTKYDFYVKADAVGITINTTFNASKVLRETDGKLIVKNYLHIKTIDSEGTPISNADVQVKDKDNVVYASSGYNGNDSQTNSDGEVNWILITDRIYSGVSIYENRTWVNVSKSGFTFNDLPREVNMSSSHREDFQSNEKIPEFNTLIIPIFIMIILFISMRKLRMRN